jgi:hypothetical protein
MLSLVSSGKTNNAKQVMKMTRGNRFTDINAIFFKANVLIILGQIECLLSQRR